jgi:hypothetical protein
MPTPVNIPDGGRTIGSYSTYEEAAQAIDLLSDRGFPVKYVTITGRDVMLVERVLGRLTVGRSALAGAGTGMWFGLLVGVVFWIVTPWFPGAVLSAVLLGAAFGAVWGAVAHAMTGGKRDFASVGGLSAARFDLTVDPEHADEALRILSSADTGTVSHARD